MGGVEHWADRNAPSLLRIRVRQHSSTASRVTLRSERGRKRSSARGQEAAHVTTHTACSQTTGASCSEQMGGGPSRSSNRAPGAIGAVPTSSVGAPPRTTGVWSSMRYGSSAARQQDTIRPTDSRRCPHGGAVASVGSRTTCRCSAELPLSSPTASGASSSTRDATLAARHGNGHGITST